MTIYSTVRRRILPKCSPLIKRVVLPIGVIFFLLNALSKSPEKISIEEDLILPGEALDPLAKAKSRSHAKENKFISPDLLKKKVEKIPSIQKDFLKADIAGIPSPLGDHHNLNVIAPPVEITNKLKKNDKKQKKGFLDDDSDVPPRIQTNWSMAKANIPDSDKVRFKPHAITNDTVTLTLMSSEDKVFMSINKKEIYRAINKRGLHVVVINQFSGRVMAKRVFDTFLEGVEEDMVEFLDDITDGRIVVFAVLDEISTGLTWKGREKLREMGCRWSKKIGYRDMWAMITRKGGLKVAETFSNVATADTGYEWGGPIFMRSDFDLEEKPVECRWPRNERNEARRLFCLRYEGYGTMCRCDVMQWEDVFFSFDKKENERLKRNPLYKNTATVILATNRTYNLYRTLKSLYEAPGLNTEKLAVYTEAATRETRALTKLFGVTLVESGSYKNTTVTQRVRHKVQRVFRDIFGVQFEPNTVPQGGLPMDVIPPFNAENILILEDDTMVAIDIFKYFYAVAPILEKDKTILAISAFNNHGYRDVASEQVAFYRTSDTQPLAVLLPSRTIKNILVPSWPTVKEEESEWWTGMSTEMRNNKGDIVYPELPRAKHCNYDGYLIKGTAQKELYKNHILSYTTQYDIPEETVNRLELKKYKKWVEKTIKDSKKIEFDFCKHDMIYGQEPNAMFVTYDGVDDTHWKYVMKCLKTWSIFVSGGWRDVWQFHFHGRVLSVIGVPNSPFSYLKSANDVAVTSPPNTNHSTTTS